MKFYFYIIFLSVNITITKVFDLADYDRLFIENIPMLDTLNVDALSEVKEIQNVDSVFYINIEILRRIVNKEEGEVVVSGKDHQLDTFLAAFVYLYYDDDDFFVLDKHYRTLSDRRRIDELEKWYQRNREKIQLRTLKLCYFFALWYNMYDVDFSLRMLDAIEEFTKQQAIIGKKRRLIKVISN